MVSGQNRLARTWPAFGRLREGEVPYHRIAALRWVRQGRAVQTLALRAVHWQKLELVEALLEAEGAVCSFLVPASTARRLL